MNRNSKRFSIWNASKWNLGFSILSFLLAWYWINLNMKTINTTFHEISLCTEGGNEYYVNGIDTVLGAQLDIFIDSDSILQETNNKYRSRIGITVYYEKAKNDTTPKPIIFKLYSRPKLDDVFVKKDTMIFNSITENFDKEKKDTFLMENKEYEEYVPEIIKSNSKDSVFDDYCIMAKAFPIKNHQDLNGKWVEGCQSIYFYSNKLGQHDHSDNLLLRFLNIFGIEMKDCYYNYSIDFNKFPKAHFLKESVMGSIVNFTFGDYKYDSLFSYNKNKKLLYNFIHPAPLRMLNGRIEYFTKDIMKEIYTNKGIIIQAVDVDQMNKNNYKTFLATIIVGIIITFGLECLKEAIKFLYRLNKRRKKARKLLSSSGEKRHVEKKYSCNGNEEELNQPIDTGSGNVSQLENDVNIQEYASSEKIELDNDLQNQSFEERDANVKSQSAADAIEGQETLQSDTKEKE